MRAWPAARPHCLPRHAGRLRRRRAGRRYDAEATQRGADCRTLKDKSAGKRTPFSTACTQAKLAVCWSPEQIAGRLRLNYPDEPEKHVACKAICRRLAKDSRQYATGKPLRGHPRHLRHNGLSHVHDKKHTTLPLPCMTSRPEEDCHGHWECDTVHGTWKSGFIMEYTAQVAQATMFPQGLNNRFLTFPQDFLK